jgi:hypothetical protein
MWAIGWQHVPWKRLPLDSNSTENLNAMADAERHQTPMRTVIHFIGPDVHTESVAVSGRIHQSSCQLLEITSIEYGDLSTHRHNPSRSTQPHCDPHNRIAIHTTALRSTQPHCDPRL